MSKSQHQQPPITLNLDVDINVNDDKVSKNKGDKGDKGDGKGKRPSNHFLYSISKDGFLGDKDRMARMKNEVELPQKRKIKDIRDKHPKPRKGIVIDFVGKYVINPRLADFMGLSADTEMSNNEIVAYFTKYISDNSLRNGMPIGYIRLDDQLAELVGKSGKISRREFRQLLNVYLHI